MNKNLYKKQHKKFFGQQAEDKIKELKTDPTLDATVTNILKDFAKDMEIRYKNIFRGKN
jgi:hypothetical protein